MRIEVLYVKFVPHSVLIDPESKSGHSCQSGAKEDWKDLIGHGGSCTESIQHNIPGINIASSTISLPSDCNKDESEEEEERDVFHNDLSYYGHYKLFLVHKTNENII